MGWRIQTAERSAWREFGRRHSGVIIGLWLGWRILLPAAALAGLAAAGYGLWLIGLAVWPDNPTDHLTRAATRIPGWVWPTFAAAAITVAGVAVWRHNHIPLYPTTRRTVAVVCAALVTVAVAGSAATTLLQ